jgi:hypothetical protein
LVKRQESKNKSHSSIFQKPFIFKPSKQGQGHDKDSLDDADLVGNVEGVIVGGQANVRLLLTVGAHQGVHLGHVDVVQLLHRRLDLVLVGLITKKNNLN